METNNIPIEDDATSRKELLAIIEALIKWRQYLLDTMEPFKVWMIRVFLRASQTKQTTSSVVLEVTRLQFHSMTYPRQDKYKGRHSFKKRSG